jgi:hypothetical protein
MATSLAINGLAPLTSDEGRFTGFGFRILDDGRWIPLKYDENIYYQYFNVVPFLEALVSMVTGLDMINVVSPLLVLLLTFFVTLVIYALARKIINMQSENSNFLNLAVLSPILFLSTPTLSTIGFIPQWLAVSLLLLTILVILRRPRSQSNLVLVLIIAIAGVMIHATYPVLLMTSLGAIMLIKALKGAKISGIFSCVALITVVYWANTLIMDNMLIFGIDWLNGFIRIASSGIMPFSQTQAEYSAAPSWMAYPWALLPSLALALIFLTFLFSKSQSNIKNAAERFSIGLGVCGLLFLALGFISRTFGSSHVSFVRYSYSACFLLLPASIVAITKITSRQRVISTLLVGLVITTSAFCAVQDPAFSPDLYRFTTAADKRSWSVAGSLVPFLSPNVSYRFDTRIGIGVEALTPRDRQELLLKDELNPEIVFVNLDEVGRSNVEFWFGSNWAQVIENGSYSTIFSDGCYKGFLRIK